MCLRMKSAKPRLDEASRRKRNTMAMIDGDRRGREEQKQRRRDLRCWGFERKIRQGQKMETEVGVWVCRDGGGRGGAMEQQWKKENAEERGCLRAVLARHPGVRSNQPAMTSSQVRLADVKLGCIRGSVHWKRSCTG